MALVQLGSAAPRLHVLACSLHVGHLQPLHISHEVDPFPSTPCRVAPLHCRVVNCEFSWTPDNSTIAMKYTPFNGTVDDGLIRSGSDLAIAWNVLYVIDVVTQQLQEVARTPDYSRLLHVLLLRDTVFSPDSRCDQAGYPCF